MTGNRRSFLSALIAVPVLGKLFKFQTTSLPEPLPVAKSLGYTRLNALNESLKRHYSQKYCDYYNGVQWPGIKNLTDEGTDPIMLPVPK